MLHLAHACIHQAAAADPLTADELVDKEVSAMIEMSQDEIDVSLEMARVVSKVIGDMILS